MRIAAALLAFALFAPCARAAQQTALPVPAVPVETPADDASIDGASLGDGLRQLLARAPDRDVDALFQAVHASAGDLRQSRALCTVFARQDGPALERIQDFAATLDAAGQQRFADALAGLFLAGLQGRASAPYDAVAARQALKSNMARAAILHEGFVEGLQPGESDDAAAEAACCRSLGWMLDTLGKRPLAERAQVTRLLLDEGLRQVR